MATSFGFTRREWMSAAATLPLSGAVRPPNIVFVLVDDLRWDELRCNGHPFAISPNADRLAREGVNFLNAFATTPLCSPSRASFLPANILTATASSTIPIIPQPATS
jgi:hypothetical protein